MDMLSSLSVVVVVVAVVVVVLVVVVVVSSLAALLEYGSNSEATLVVTYMIHGFVTARCRVILCTTLLACWHKAVLVAVMVVATVVGEQRRRSWRTMDSLSFSSDAHMSGLLQARRTRSAREEELRIKCFFEKISLTSSCNSWCSSFSG